MPNKIARGTTGLGEVRAQDYHNGWYFSSWTLELGDGPGSVSLVAYSPAELSGYKVTEDGHITLPSNAPLGEGTAHYCAQGSNDQYCNSWVFNSVCMTVVLTITRLSSAPVPGSNPIQYEHKYAVQAQPQGGLAPYTYVWSTSAGSISSSGPSVILSITNTTANFGGVTGTVTCTVTDSDTPSCSASETISIASSNPSIEGWRPCVDPDNSQKQCDCKQSNGAASCKAENCAEPTGNATISSLGGDPANYKSYARGSGNSQAPTMGVAKH